MKDTIQAGDTFEYEVSFSEYPSDEWTCTMALRGAGAYSIASSAVGNGFKLSETAANTAKYTAGNYEYFIYVSKTSTGERYMVRKGRVEVLADITATTTYDPRSTAQIALEAVEATIQGRATKDQLSYEIAGRKIEKIPVPDLITLWNKLKREVANEKRAERIANGLGAGNKVLLRF